MQVAEGIGEAAEAGDPEASRPIGEIGEQQAEPGDADGKAYGRPVGVVIDKRGALLVADDVGNTVWRVAAAKASRKSEGESRK